MVGGNPTLLPFTASVSGIGQAVSEFVDPLSVWRRQWCIQSVNSKP